MSTVNYIGSEKNPDDFLVRPGFVYAPYIPLYFSSSVETMSLEKEDRHSYEIWEVDLVSSKFRWIVKDFLMLKDSILGRYSVYSDDGKGLYKVCQL